MKIPDINSIIVYATINSTQQRITHSPGKRIKLTGRIRGITANDRRRTTGINNKIIATVSAIYRKPVIAAQKRSVIKITAQYISIYTKAGPYDRSGNLSAACQRQKQESNIGYDSFHRMDGLDFKATAITKSSQKLISVWQLSFINLSVNSYWVLAESLNSHI